MAVLAPKEHHRRREQQHTNDPRATNPHDVRVAAASRSGGRTTPTLHTYRRLPPSFCPQHKSRQGSSPSMHVLSHLRVSTPACLPSPFLGRSTTEHPTALWQHGSAPWGRSREQQQQHWGATASRSPAGRATLAARRRAGPRPGSARRQQLEGEAGCGVACRAGRGDSSASRSPPAREPAPRSQRGGGPGHDPRPGSARRAVGGTGRLGSRRRGRATRRQRAQQQQQRGPGEVTSGSSALC